MYTFNVLSQGCMTTRCIQFKQRKIYHVSMKMSCHKLFYDQIIFDDILLLLKGIKRDTEYHRY